MGQRQSARAPSPPDAPASPHAASASAPTPCPLAADSDPFLPPPVMTHLCALIPLRPRLLVLGRVSKRWRAAVLASVTHLPDERNYTPTLVARFPNLTHVATSFGRLAEASLPATLRSLRIRGANSLKIARERLPRLSQLTRLECVAAAKDAPAEAWRAVMADFVPKYAPNLQHFALESLPAPALAAAVRPYPRLNSLAWSPIEFTDTASAALADLLALHAEQLTSLTLDVGHSEPSQHLTTRLCPLSRMCTLSLSLKGGNDAWLRLFLKFIPADTNLTLSIATPGPLTPLACEYVTALTLDALLDDPPFLARCTRLESLIVHSPSHLFYATHTPPPRLQQLSLLSAVPPPESWLAPLTSLTSVSLRFPLPDGLCLRNLRHFDCPLADVGRGTVVLSHVFDFSPRLQRAITSLHDFSNLDSVARYAQEHGIEFLHVSIAVPAKDLKDLRETIAQCKRLPRSLQWLKLTVDVLVAK